MRSKSLESKMVLQRFGAGLMGFAFGGWVIPGTESVPLKLIVIFGAMILGVILLLLGVSHLHSYSN